MRSRPGTFFSFFGAANGNNRDNEYARNKEQTPHPYYHITSL